MSRIKVRHVFQAFLVRNKACPPDRKVGSAKYSSKGCQVYLNVNETDFF